MVKHIIGAVFCLFVLNSCSNSNKNTEDATKTEIDSSSNNQIEEIEVKRDSSDILYTEAVYWIEKLSKDFEGDNLKSAINISADDISGKIYDFEQAADNVKLANNKWGDSTKNKLKQLRTLLVNTQKKMFPIYRKIYALDIKEKLWEDNVNVYLEGNTIRFVGSIFANNKNIKDVQNTVEYKLEKMRFKNVIYQWYKGSNGTRYTLSSKKDSDL